ncbi:MAG: hypothetical protein R3D98_04295 [Candidatus Krumholzibacteriia bacterium]
MLDLAGPVEGAGEAEVEDLDPAVGAQLDVAGFEVAVHDAVLVSVFEASREAARHAHHLVDVHGAGAQAHAQVLALGQLHHEDGLAVELLVAVDAGDVLVLQAREQARLPLEPAAAIGITGDVAGQDLEGDVAFEARVAGAIDLAHAAAADELFDAVVADGAADHAWAILG